MAHVLDLPESLLVLGPRHVVLELLHRWERGMGERGEPRNSSQGWGPGRRPPTSASWPSYHCRSHFSYDNAVWPRGQKTEDTASIRQPELLKDKEQSHSLPGPPSAQVRQSVTEVTTALEVIIQV